jgi:uncharacterized ParB-like nuclease family protein
MSKAKTQMIKLRDIVVPPNRMRQLRPEKVDEFAESIAARGQLQPIIVRPRGDTDYLLVVGSHRLEAVRKLAHEAIECRVLDGMDADQALLAEIDENLVESRSNAVRARRPPCQAQAVVSQVAPRNTERESRWPTPKNLGQNVQGFDKRIRQARCKEGR